MPRVADLIPSRRDALKLGTLSLLGGIAETALWPPKLRAAGSANPRRTARFCIVVEAAGAISHVDTFDFKESKGTQDDFDVREVRNGLYLPFRLFPEMSAEMDKVAILRTLWSHEVVHFRGEYYTRAGRPLNPAQAAEIPPVGSVVAYEMESHRREADTFPTFVSFNVGKYALPTGFLHPRFSGLDIDARATGDNAAANDNLAALEERFRLLRKLDEVMAPSRRGRGEGMTAFRSFQQSAYEILGDPRWPAAFALSNEDKTRYGANEVGLGCLLARNLILADAGTRFVHVRHGGWDHHAAIFDHLKRSNHYKHCNDLDRALANLLRDLSAAASPRDSNTSLLDETLVVVPTEFGRVPGPLNGVAGRHHYNQTYIGLMAGGGVQGGRILGRTDDVGEKAVETGWRYRMQPKTENIYASVYSALAIDWMKEITNTPSKRAYCYIDPLGATAKLAGAPQVWGVSAHYRFQ